MKNNKIVLLILISIMVISCYKDDSAANYKIINPLVISDTKTSFELFTLDTLEIKPLVYKEGLSDDDLSFKWTIYHNLIVPKVLDSTMSLKVAMPFSPNPAEYSIIYEVTDKTTGLSIEKEYKVKMNSPYGTGLIVCHSQDGVYSDVSLIRAWNYSTAITKDTVMSNLFSRVNNRKINGVINGVVSTQDSQSSALTVTTPNGIDRVDPRDYTYIDGGYDVFLIKPTKLKPRYIISQDNASKNILNNDGDLHVRNFRNGNRFFSNKLFSSDMKPTSISGICQPYWNTAICFDEIGGRFLAVNAGSLRFDNLTKTETDKFGWNEFQNYHCLSIVYGPGYPAGLMLAVMKNKMTNEVEVFGFTENYTAKDMRATTRFKLSIADCPEIDKAILFEASEKASVLFYATPNKIYTANFLTGKIITNLVYETSPNEEITTMNMWSNYRAGGKIKYSNPNPNADQKVLEMGSQHRMMVISTYNESKKEGYIRNIAMISTSTGELEKNRDLHTTFGGFGKISVTQLQEK